MTTGRDYSRTDDDGLDRRRSRTDLGAQPLPIEDDDATAARFAELGIATPAASVLPRNFAAATSAEDFVFEQMTSTIRTIGRQVGIAIETPGPAAYRAIHEKDHEIIAPVLQFSQAFILDGGATLLVTFLEHLAAHVASRWGVKKTRESSAHFEMVVTQGKRAKRLTYRGPLDGLPLMVEVAHGFQGG